MSHGVDHGGKSYDPKKNWLSVGYYATVMSLVLDVETEGGSAWDSGPTSTVGGNSSGFFNLGATPGACSGR